VPFTQILVIGAPNLGEDPREDVDGRRDWWADQTGEQIRALIHDA
jgi:hypothetical protein